MHHGEIGGTGIQRECGATTNREATVMSTVELSIQKSACTCTFCQLAEFHSVVDTTCNGPLKTCVRELTLANDAWAYYEVTATTPRGHFKYQLSTRALMRILMCTRESCGGSVCWANSSRLECPLLSTSVPDSYLTLSNLATRLCNAWHTIKNAHLQIIANWSLLQSYK